MKESILRQEKRFDRLWSMTSEEKLVTREG